MIPITPMSDGECDLDLGCLGVILTFFGAVACIGIIFGIEASIATLRIAAMIAAPAFTALGLFLVVGAITATRKDKP